jgi:hypothetical protein
MTRKNDRRPFFKNSSAVIEDIKIELIPPAISRKTIKQLPQRDLFEKDY